MIMKSRLTTLCYIEKDQKYLMLHRVFKKNDVNKDKWIGVGGHFEEDESPEDCLLREVKEETGLILTSWQFRGIVTFCCEGHPTEYMCLYIADGFVGEPKLEECDEGELVWVDKSEISNLNLWDGDLLFFDLLDKGAPFFSLQLCYKGDGTWQKAVLDGRELELFDICDREGNPTGHVKERSMVHQSGDLHRTVHIWVINRDDQGRIRILLQKRSRDKDAYPGCYDISAAGHIHAGDDFLPSALRELEEELGIKAREEELRFIGFHDGYTQAEFWGKPFRNWEISAVYLYEKPVELHDLKLQESEVEEAVFLEYDAILAGMADESLPNCFYPKELEMVRKALEPGYDPEGVKVIERYQSN